MKRTDFVKQSVLGVGAIIALPKVITALTKDVFSASEGDCQLTPAETAGPFSIKTPNELKKANIVGDRTGVALLINLCVQNKNRNCQPMPDVLVDVWHCDAQGNYSEYENFGHRHFLRGRQTTDADGQVAFLSIYPGWYRGRAPHIHVEVLDNTENSLLVTQIAFPDDTSNTIYATKDYKAGPYTTNQRDGIFRNSLSQNLADLVEGNLENGFTLQKNIIVNG